MSSAAIFPATAMPDEIGGTLCGHSLTTWSLAIGITAGLSLTQVVEPPPYHYAAVFSKADGGRVHAPIQLT